MAALKWASTGLGWAGAGCPGCGRLLQPPGMGTAPKNCPRRHTALPASLFLLLKGCTIGQNYAASYWQPGGRAPRAPRRAHGSQSSNEYCAARPPQGCRATVLASQGAHRLIWLLRRRPLRWPLLRRLAGGTAAGGRCTRAFPRGRRRAARAQLCWHAARVVTQPRRTGGAAREARAISYFQGWIRPFQGYTFENP